MRQRLVGRCWSASRNFCWEVKVIHEIVSYSWVSKLRCFCFNWQLESYCKIDVRILSVLEDLTSLISIWQKETNICVELAMQLEEVRNHEVNWTPGPLGPRRRQEIGSLDPLYDVNDGGVDFTDCQSFVVVVKAWVYQDVNLKTLTCCFAGFASAPLNDKRYRISQFWQKDIFPMAATTARLALHGVSWAVAVASKLGSPEAAINSPHHKEVIKAVINNLHHKVLDGVKVCGGTVRWWFARLKSSQMFSFYLGSQVDINSRHRAINSRSRAINSRSRAINSHRERLHHQVMVRQARLGSSPIHLKVPVDINSSQDRVWLHRWLWKSRVLVASRRVVVTIPGYNQGQPGQPGWGTDLGDFCFRFSSKSPWLQDRFQYFSQTWKQQLGYRLPGSPRGKRCTFHAAGLLRVA